MRSSAPAARGGRGRADAGGQPRHPTTSRCGAASRWPARRPGRSIARGPFCRSRPPAIIRDLLLALAEHALAEGRDDEARRALERVDRRWRPIGAPKPRRMLAPLAAGERARARRRQSPNRPAGDEPVGRGRSTTSARRTGRRRRRCTTDRDVERAGRVAAAAEPPAVTMHVDRARMVGVARSRRGREPGRRRRRARSAEPEPEPRGREPEPEPEPEPVARARGALRRAVAPESSRCRPQPTAGRRRAPSPR